MTVTMIGLHEFKALPQTLAVRCPACGAPAQFEGIGIAKIQQRKDIAYFQQSPDFDYVQVRTSEGSLAHGAIHYYGLTRRDIGSIDDLPEGYMPKSWQPGRGAVASRYVDDGTVFCAACGLCAKHVLNWPDDALFHVSWRGQSLWAFDRETASALLTYIQSEDRTLARYRHRVRRFLAGVPTHFLTKKARLPVARKLKTTLRGTR